MFRLHINTIGNCKKVQDFLKKENILFKDAEFDLDFSTFDIVLSNENKLSSIEKLTEKFGVFYPVTVASDITGDYVLGIGGDI